MQPLFSQDARRANRSLVTAALWLVLAFTALPAAAAERTLLVMGDSLSAAYGMAREQGWVALLERRLARTHPDWRVVNASVSGETTAGGASRIAGEIATHAPDLVVIELGANDGLRGLPVEHARANLQRMIAAARAHGAPVLLLGMRLPPNYGPAYTQAFEAMYRSLAAPDVFLLPFLLDPIARDTDAFQADQLHPTATAQPRLLEHVWPALEPLLEHAAQPRAAG